MFMKFGKRLRWIACFSLIFLAAAAGARAEDERSIRELRDALVALSPTVDPAEAALFSVTVHTAARSLARQYQMSPNPAYQNFLINIGARQRGYCAHFTRDIGTRLKEFRFKTLVLHWGAAYARTADEDNCLVVTARNQPFLDGIVLDAWRQAGRLFWSPVRKDYEYEMGHRVTQFGQYPHSGITAWKEDVQESAWLQAEPPRLATKPAKSSGKPKRTASRR